MSKRNGADRGRNEDAFIKGMQEMRAKMAGGMPSPLPEEAKKFNQYMMNDGEHATALAGKLTAGMDSAFPRSK